MFHCSNVYCSREGLDDNGTERGEVDVPESP